MSTGSQNEPNSEENAFKAPAMEEKDLYSSMEEQKLELEHYLEQNKVQHLLHSITKLLLEKKPENPVSYLAKIFEFAQSTGLDCAKEGFSLKLIADEAEKE